MLNMTPFGSCACVAFRCQKIGNSSRAMIAWTGHTCSCQPTKAQIRGAVKHGWRVLAVVGSTWCVMLIIMACTTIPSVQSWTLALGVSCTLPLRSAGRSSKPLIPSGSSVQFVLTSCLPTFCRNRWLREGLVWTRDCIRQRPSLSTQAGRKLACAGGFVFAKAF